MASAANISGKKTNHSARKTSIQTLLHADIPPTEVMQISGHKNIQSLNAYSEVSENQHQSMSHILANVVSRPENMLSDDIPGSIINELLNDDDFSNDVVMNTNSNVNNDVPKPMKMSDYFNGCTFNGNVTINFNNYAEFPKRTSKRPIIDSNKSNRVESSDSE